MYFVNGRKVITILDKKFIDIGLKKINRETDLTWQEISEMFGMESGEQARCLIKRYRKQNGILPTVTQKVESEIDNKKFELQKERYKLQTEKVELNKWLRENARAEMFIEEIKKSIQAVTPPLFRELPVQKGKKDAILGFSDIHFGKQFKSINNEYNIDIFKERMELLLSETVDICRKENLSHIHIINTSDSIEGILRISQLMSLQLGFIDMTIQFSRMMVEWLNKLSEYVKITYHHVPSANHSEVRPLGTQAGQFPREDMERIIVNYIHDMLKNNSRIEIPLYENDSVRFDIFGYKVLGKHGHNIKNIKNSIKDLSMLHREFIDYLILGHLHHAEEISLHEGNTNNCEVLLLPSIMGSDTFSDKLLTGSKAGAKMYIIEEGKGKTISYNILLN